ncbi:MAG: nuclear transport factor 2 family protein [Microbacteriaceae bacterium]|nr:nuclear transport factor 2 family protein [Microbacteriaceae bacterium]
MSFDEALARHLAAIENRDLAEYEKTVHSDAVVVLGNGTIIQGLTAILELHIGWFADTDWSLKTEVLHRTELHGLASVVLKVDYHDVDQNGAPTQHSYLLGLVFTKSEDDDWLLIHDQNTFF